MLMLNYLLFLNIHLSVFFQILNRTVAFKSSFAFVPKIKFGWFAISFRPIYSTHGKLASTRYVNTEEGIFKRVWRKIKYLAVEKAVSNK